MDRITDRLPADLAEPEPGDEAWAADLGETLAEAGVDPGEEKWSTYDAAALVEAPERVEAIRRAQRWHVADDRAAEWAMRHVAAAEERLAALDQQRDEWIARIQAWHDAATRPDRARAAFFRGHLERYAFMRRHKDPSAKSLVLPSGVVQTRHHAPKIVVTDEAAAVEAAKRWAPDAVKVSESVLVSKLNKRIRPGVLVHFEMGCGHADSARCELDGPSPAIGAIAWCESCEATVEIVDVTDWSLSAIADDRAPAGPGFSVEPAKMTATVKVS